MNEFERGVQSSSFNLKSSCKNPQWIWGFMQKFCKEQLAGSMVELRNTGHLKILTIILSRPLLVDSTLASLMPSCHSGITVTFIVIRWRAPSILIISASLKGHPINHQMCMWHCCMWRSASVSMPSSVRHWCIYHVADKKSELDTWHRGLESHSWLIVLKNIQCPEIPLLVVF